MTTTPAAALDGVTKRYRLGAERSNWRALVPGPFGEPSAGDWFTALDDVTLRVAPGESVGILGRNGAGKSTLLKILAGIVRPTSGAVSVSGRMAAVIELGVGFNPELTGAENLRFAGSLFGVTPAEVDRRYDDIVEFSGLAEFMHTPLKRYSTGMRARLGFALVTSFDADVVILDEVLSVGDWEFQQRCLERIGELHRAGAAVVAVSHSHWLITQICQRAVMLEHGRITCEGDPLSVIEQYLGETTITDTDKDERFPVLDELAATDGPSPVRLVDLELDTDEISPHDRLRFRVTVEVDRPVDGQLVMSLYTMGRAVFADPEEGPSHVLSEPGRWTVTGTTQPLPFSPGAFKLRLAVLRARDPEDHLHRHVGALATAGAPFRVLGPASTRPGLVFDTAWEARPAGAGAPAQEASRE